MYIWIDENERSRIYHGHGTFNLEFVEDKEPEYEWRYYSPSRDTFTERYTDNRWEKYKHAWSSTNIDDWVKIEESKREVKK